MMSMKNLNQALAELGFSTRGEAFDAAIHNDNPLDSLAVMEKRLGITPETEEAKDE